MSKVAIVTDTVSCLPKDISARYNIGIVPFSLTINGKTYLDGVNITCDQIWELFPTMKEFSSGAPGPGNFAEAFRKAGKSHEGVVCVVVSGGLSATYKSALQAKMMVQAENPGLSIEIIDSKNALGAEGFVTLAAARVADAGGSLAEAVSAANAVVPAASFIMALDSAKYVMKTGRAPQSTVQNEMANIRPVLGIIKGKGTIEKLGVAQTAQQSMENLINLARANLDLTKPLHFMVHYTNNREAGEELKKLVESTFKPAELYVSPQSPVIAGSSGPGLALTFYS
jgi:DegV family protein with EDD domain